MRVEEGEGGFTQWWEHLETWNVQALVSLYLGSIYPDAEADDADVDADADETDACITGCLAARGKLNQARLDFEKLEIIFKNFFSAKAATFS